MYNRLCCVCVCVCGTERNVLLNTPSCINGPVFQDANLTCLHSRKNVFVFDKIPSSYVG